MINKKGFTLTELLAVIAIIAIISLIAVPNIIGLINNVKKDNMLDDAKKMISLAKMVVNSDYNIRNSNSVEILTLKTIDKTGDIKNDPDSGLYDRDNSYVSYSVSSGTPNYCVYLLGSKRHIGTQSACVNEVDLISNNVVKDN